jgi:hypothetical protein
MCKVGYEGSSPSGGIISLSSTGRTAGYTGSNPVGGTVLPYRVWLSEGLLCP